MKDGLSTKIDFKSANELDKKVHEYLQYFDVNSMLSRLNNVPDGQRLEVLNMTGSPNLYYQYLACLVRAVKPNQIIELGASIGVSTIMMATQMKEGAILYSVDDASDYKEGPKDWSALDREYPNVIQVVGNDLDLSIYPKDFDISKTDILFIDTLHYGGQLMKELTLYGPLIPKGCVVLFDDIKTNDMYQVWEAIKDDKIDLTYPCHYSGFGMLIKG